MYYASIALLIILTHSTLHTNTILPLLQFQQQLEQFPKSLSQNDKELIKANLKAIDVMIEEVPKENSNMNFQAHVSALQNPSPLALASEYLRGVNRGVATAWYTSILGNKKTYNPTDQVLITQFETALAELWRVMNEERSKFTRLAPEDEEKLHALSGFLHQFHADLDKLSNPGTVYFSQPSASLTKWVRSVQQFSDQRKWEEQILEKYNISLENWKKHSQDKTKYPPPTQAQITNISKHFNSIWENAWKVDLQKIYQETTWTASTNTEALFIASALGDALGRITEFKTTDETLKERYTYYDQVSIAKSMITQKNITQEQITQLMYTDDTVLSLSVAKAIITTKKIKDWTDEQLLSQIAKNIMHDITPANDPLYGPRAHGRTAPKAVEKLNKVDQTSAGWWKQGVYSLGLGSGSIMRVAPIVFAAPNDLPRVQKLAVEQSLITHGHPAALAACSAFATGIFYALRQASPETIAEKMIQAAEEFDEKIREVNSNIPSKPFEEWEQEEEKEEDFHIRFRAALIADQLTTADMLRYVFSLWKEHAHATLATPDVVLGHAETKPNLKQFSKNKGQAKGRSKTGGLLGWNGDEAAAAALYIFLFNSRGDTWKALQQAVYTVGDSDTIATLVGALMGARYGFTLTGENAALISELENFQEIRKIAKELTPKKSS